MPVVPSPTLEAQRTLQVAAVIRDTHQRFTEGYWERGRQFAPGGRGCVVGGIRQATEWTHPEVEATALRMLASHLPQPLRMLSLTSHRWALMVANDLPRGRQRILRLLEAVMADLGIPVEETPTTHPAPRSPGDDADITIEHR